MSPLPLATEEAVLQPLAAVDRIALATAARLDSAASPGPPLPSLDYRLELTRSLHTIAGPLQRVDGVLSDSLQSRAAAVQPLLDYIAALGGKKLRPALLLLTAQAFGPVSDEAVRLAAVVELVHTATLVHDDILDAAAWRRHQPTVHSCWDVPAAILTGDWLFTQAYALANEGDSTLPGRWVAEAAKAVCEGEIQQGLAAGGSPAEADYLRTLAGKTGALCAISCGLGGWTAGCDTSGCQRLYDFGMKLGIAFQIHDDWLDIWGDPQKTGKPVGGDLQGGKETLPVLRFRQVARCSDVQQLEMLTADPQQLADRMGDVRKLLESTDAAAYCRGYATQLVDQALNELDVLPDGPEKESLRRLAVAAIQRTC